MVQLLTCIFQIQHSDTHPFNGHLSGTTRVSRYQKGKTNLDFIEARDSEWQWHQLGHMQVCISFQTDNHASTPPLQFFTGQMPFLPPNKQRQSTESKYTNVLIKIYKRKYLTNYFMSKIKTTYRWKAMVLMWLKCRSNNTFLAVCVLHKTEMQVIMIKKKL